MIIEQCSINIFFIDWENPRPTKGDVISVWRMYFVANEWNELQVSRKSSISLQIALVLFILNVSKALFTENKKSTLLLNYYFHFQVFNCERFAMEIPSFYSQSNSPSSYNSVLRLALGSTTYLVVSLAQNIWNSAIFERYVEHKIQRFTDLCTLSNISVWLLVLPRYGFYIHGR